MDWSRYSAVLFDLDGVVTPTALVHMSAWHEMFTAFLAGRADQAPYTDEDYYAHVDGLPRDDGVRGFLASRGITLPEGSPDDPPEAETVNGLGNRKNQAFNAILARDGVTPYPGTVEVIHLLADAGIPMAIVSSSKNTPAVLRAAKLSHFFSVVVDGNVAEAESLAGKPSPDTFLRAAQLLGVAPATAVAIEDAISGVAAGAAGGFGLVIGVNRGAGEKQLRLAGAGVVVDDLGELA